MQALARLEFGEHLLSMLGLAGTIKLEVAKNLPPALFTGDSGSGGRGGGINANAFRNSYLWKSSTGVLYIHGKVYLLHSCAVGRGTARCRRALLSLFYELI